VSVKIEDAFPFFRFSLIKSNQKISDKGRSLNKISSKRRSTLSFTAPR
jgi:hypothetical protein